MITDKEVILLGTCARTHGKKGDLQVNFENDLLPDADGVEFVVLRMDNILTPFRLLDWREKGAESYIISLSDVDTEEKAQRLCGKQVYLLRRDLTENPDEELLTWDDLVGYEVIDDEMGGLGKIAEVDDSTMNTLFILESDAVIPAHEDFITEIDSEAEKLYVSLPAGIV